MLITKIVGLISSLSFVSVFISMVTPGWSVMHYISTSKTSNERSTTSIRIGLWYTEVCVSGNDIAPMCKHFTYTELRNTNKITSGVSMEFHSIIEAEVETTIGTVAILIAAVLIFPNSSDNKRKIIARISASSLFTGGILVLIPAGRFTHACIEMIRFNNMDISTGVRVEVGIPYSLIIVAFGIALSLCAFIILLVLILCKKRPETREYASHGYTYSQNVPPSEVTGAKQMKSVVAKKMNSDKVENYLLEVK